MVQRGNYLKNAALLTGSGLVLRLAGMAFRIYLAGALGSEGLGLYQLILAFYGVFITLATSGVSVAATRLVAEELSESAGAARTMVRQLCVLGGTFGAAAGAAQLILAGLAARWWLGDVRAAVSIRVLAFSLPFMAVAAVLRGAFLALRQVKPNVVSQLIEQSFRIGVVLLMLSNAPEGDLAARCARVVLGETLSEVLSTGLMLLFYRRSGLRALGFAPRLAEKNAGPRIWAILWPVEGARCLQSGLHTAENMLVPACLTVYLAAQGGRTAAVAQYGALKGMAMPLLFFPFSLLGALATLLMPEITEAHVRGQTHKLHALLDRMFTLTQYAALLAAALFAVWGAPLAQLLYKSAETGFYLRVLAPMLPFMYLESMVDSAIKGIGEQKAAFGYTVWDSVLRIGGVIALLPRLGMKGFLFVIIASNLFTCLMNFARLLGAVRLPLRLWRWFVAPALCAVGAGLAGAALQPLLAELPPAAQLLAGAGVTVLVYLGAALPLGLGRAVKSALKKDAETKKKQSA